MTVDDFISEFRNMIHPDFIIEHQSGVIILTETGETKCPEVRIKTSGKSLLLRFDVKNQPGIFPYFPNNEHLKKMCDYFLLTISPNTNRSERKIIVILCELKSGNSDKAIKQLNAGKIFCDFLISTQRRITASWKEKSPEIIYGYITFASNPTVRKGTTKPGKSSNKYINGKIPYLTLDCSKEHQLALITAQLSGKKLH